MNFQQLLQQRDVLLQQARLANLAFAYDRLGTFAARISRAGLEGAVALHSGNPDAEHPWPGLFALEGSQSVIEEHFLDEEMVELTDILGFLGEEIPPEGYQFRLEDLAARFLPQLRRELEAAGIASAGTADPIEDHERRGG
jgi:hypothetical protein